MEVIKYEGNVGKLWPVMELWFQEANMKHFGIDFDWPLFLDDVQSLIDGEDSCLLVLMANNEPVGFMGLRIIDSPMGEQKLMNEHYWYVIPEKRGFGGTRLLRAAENWTREQGCSHLIMNASMMASDLHDKVCQIYEKNGMTKFETSYIREV